MALQYLISPIIQLEDTNGQTLVNGKLFVYNHDTDILATIYKDFNGGAQTNPAILDELGTTIIIANNETTYDIEVYDKDDNFVLSRKMVLANGGSGGSSQGNTYNAGVDIQIRQISPNNALIDVVNNGCSNTNYGFAIGNNTSANNYGISFGINTTANQYGVAGGSYTSASNGAVVVGTYCSANKPHSLTMGDTLTNTDEASIVVGYNIVNTAVLGSHNIIAGSDLLNDGLSSYNNIFAGEANGFHKTKNSLAFGMGNSCYDTEESFIIGGVGNNISGASYGGTIGGAGNKASGSNSITIGGNGNSAVWAGVILNGNGCFASGSNSIAFQNGSSAYDGGFSQGSICVASGGQTHAEGWNTSAIGVSNHAEGGDTLASGVESHAEGGYTSAIGNCSHAEGHDSIAYGNYSHADGKSVVASGNSQNVLGRYNVPNTTDILQIGGGEYGSPVNSLVVDSSASVSVNTSAGLKNTRTFFDNLGNATYYNGRAIPIYPCTGTDFDQISTTGATGYYAVCPQDFYVPNAKKVKVDGFYQIKGGMNTTGGVPNFGADPKIQTWIIDDTNGSAIEINAASLTNGYWLPRSVPIPFSFVTGGTTAFKIGFCTEGTWTATNMDESHGSTAGNLVISYTTTIIDQE